MRPSAARRSRDARTAVQGAGGSSRALGAACEASCVRTRLLSLPLFWRVFIANACALTLAFVGLVLAPVTVSVPVAAGELAVLGAGLVALLIANLALLRPAFAPLDALAETMRRQDPLAPGVRAELIGDASVMALAQTFNDMLDRLELERRESARQALLAQEGERQRIARELHDEVGQTLTGVILLLEGLAPQVPEELREPLDEVREAVRQGADEVRTIARRLRPDALDALGLSSALAALASAFERQAKVRVERDLAPALAVSGEEELVLYRVAQEALTNVVRHADASRVKLALRQLTDAVELVITDDGIGLAADALDSSQGIRGMRERAMLVGARLSIDSRAGEGTTVRLVIAR
jgi:two-component system, NarL family, sensor histidine kinase UhpB